MDPTNRTELARARRVVWRWNLYLAALTAGRWIIWAVSVSLGGNGGNACQWAYSMSDAHKRAYGVTMMGSLGEVGHGHQTFVASMTLIFVS